MDMPLSSIEPVLPYIREAGNAAYSEQRKGTIARRYKIDGSVITKIDHQTDVFLIEKIRDLYPEVSFVTEETVHSLRTDATYTFVIDPIDGTDTFSQGMCGWCVSVGLLKDSLPFGDGVVAGPNEHALRLREVLD